MTNTLHVLIDRSLDVTPAHLVIARGRRSQDRRHVGQRDLRRSARRAAARRAFWVGPLGNAGFARERAPRLPHEHDESSESGAVAPDPLMKRAADDIESGKRPTDRSEATDAMQRAAAVGRGRHQWLQVDAARPRSVLHETIHRSLLIQARGALKKELLQ